MERWHERAFRNVAPLPYYAGNVRQEDPERVCLGVDVMCGGIEGTAFPEVKRELDRLCTNVGRALSQLELNWEYLSPPERAKKLAAIVGTAIGEFIRIHPFVNGNGRTSRILWRALLFRMGLPAQVTVLRRPPAPYGTIMAESMNGNHGPAVVAVLRGMEAPAETLPTPAARSSR